MLHLILIQNGQICRMWRLLSIIFGRILIYPISSVDSKTNIVTFQYKSGKVFTDDFSNEGARYIVENVFEELDEPGGMVPETAKQACLYYKPKPGEDIKTAEIIAPVIPEFIRFEGEPMNRRYVENIHFEGIFFMYTNWQLPAGDCNNGQASASVPACITLTGAHHCSFSSLHG